MRKKCECVHHTCHERLKVFLIALSSFLILAILCFCLYSWASGADFIFSFDFPFFKSHEIKGINSSGLDEPLKYSDGIIITAKEVYLNGDEIKIKTEIENNSDSDVEFSSRQFELTVQTVGKNITRKYYSPLYQTNISLSKGEKKDFIQSFSYENDGECSFSLSVYNEKNEKAGQILFALSDIEQNAH